MNEQQKKQYTTFMANFIVLLAEDHIPYQHAVEAAMNASSCLLAIMFEMTPSDNDNVEDFCVPVIQASFQRFYGIQDLSKLN